MSDSEFPKKPAGGVSRRTVLAGGAAVLSASIFAPSLLRAADYPTSAVNTTGLAVTDDTVTIGILHSITGTMAISETGSVQAEKLAIDQINAMGGILGRKIEYIQEDGASDWPTFAEKAKKLLVNDKVASVMGCWTSASRKAVLPVFEKRRNLYFYPTYYEGFECSKNVVYTGAVPNQQLSNFIPWIVNTLGKKKFFIVGSNYIYPREMAKVSKILIEQAGAEWVADEYLELGHSEWGAMVNKIKNSGCDVVLSNVVGDSVVAFYREYKNQGLTHDKLPICATVTSEIEIQAMGAEFAQGSYTSFPYFQAIESDTNQAFVERYRKYVNDPNAVTHHALESSYFQVYLWAQALEKAGEATPEAIREGVKGQEFDAPNGHVKIDPANLHTYLTPRIAEWLPSGQGKIIDAYDEPVQPLPYVAYGESPDNLFCTEKGLDTSKL